LHVILELKCAKFI